MSRGVGAAVVMAIAVIHIIDAPSTFASGPRYVFWLYMLLVAGAVPLITLLVNTSSPIVWAATAAYAAGPLLGYVLTRTTGLPGDSGDIGNWLDSLGMTSLLVESTLIALSATRLLRHHLALAPQHPGTAPSSSRPSAGVAFSNVHRTAS